MLSMDFVKEIIRPLLFNMWTMTCYYSALSINDSMKDMASWWH